MLYKLLEYDKIYLFSKNLHQNKYQALLQYFVEEVNPDPEVGYEVIEAPGDEIIPLEKLPVDDQKIVCFWWSGLWKQPKQHHKLFYQRAAQKLLCYLPYYKPSTRCQKISRITAAIFCIFKFLPREN